MIFHNFSQDESVILKMDSYTSRRNKQNTHMLYDCRDIDGFVEVTLMWIHPIHQNLCRAKWPRVGNNIDSGDSRFVSGYVTLPLQFSAAFIFLHLFLFTEKNQLFITQRVKGATGNRKKDGGTYYISLSSFQMCTPKRCSSDMLRKQK